MAQQAPWRRHDALVPKAEQQPVEATHHGDTRVDPYHWLRDPKYPQVEEERVLEYLKAENRYKEAVLGELEELTERIFQELKGRVAEDDDSVPYEKQGYWYQHRYRKGHEYPAHVRWRGSEAEAASAETILDENDLGKGKEYLSVRDMALSRDQKLMAYSVDFEGSERYELRFRNLETGDELPERISNTQGHVVWAADNETLYYARLDEQLRPSRVYRHKLGTDPDQDVLIYEEKDPAFWLGIDESSDEELIFIQTEDKESSEVRFWRADEPEAEPELFLERREKHEYDLDHAGGQLYLRTNDTHENFRLLRMPISERAPESWEEVIAASDERYLQGFFLRKDFLVAFEREDGLPQVRVRRLSDGEEHQIGFPDPAYTVGAGANPEYESGVLRLSYQSLVSPRSVVDYDLTTRAWTVRKVQRIPSGYDASLYTSARLKATSPDGTAVPVSVVHRLDTPLDGTAPLYLYGYGSYGHSIDPYFSANRLSLLDRGFVFAIAHVRGGSDMGRHWYDDGKRFNKQNTFSDAIAVAEFLAEKKYTSAGKIAVSGGSAGGMLVGAVINQRPELFQAAVASVPFVDCLNTMLDASLPLTPTEYTEWGNPEADPGVYAYIKSYSPYDNVKAQAYPHVFVTAGISDPRVTYWEPAKWVARLRALKTDERLLLLHTNMSAGHGGASGRFEALKELALEYTFLLLVYAHPDAALKPD